MPTTIDEGKEFGFFGMFREVQPPSRFVNTEVFDPGTMDDGYPSGAETLVTTTFVEEAGITTLTAVMDYGSKEARDAAVKTGMTDGMEQSYQLLDRVLQQLGI